MLPGTFRVRLVVCEDGTEYVERFRRFLGGEFDFVRAGSFAEALALCERSDAGAAVGALLLDQDFRRTPRESLVDGAGAHSADALADVQGILILRALRARGITLPALLFADLDDAGRAQRLERELAPLSVVSSTEGLPQIARRLRTLY